MTELRFHHVGIACRDLPKIRQFVKATHRIVADSGVVSDPWQDVDLCLLTDESGLRYELVSGPVVAAQIAKGASYYHSCYEVDDIGEGVAFLKRHGCLPVLGPVEAILFGGRKVVFLMSPMGLVELLER